MPWSCAHLGRLQGKKILVRFQFFPTVFFSLWAVLPGSKPGLILVSTVRGKQLIHEYCQQKYSDAKRKNRLQGIEFDKWQCFWATSNLKKDLYLQTFKYRAVKAGYSWVLDELSWFYLDVRLCFIIFIDSFLIEKYPFHIDTRDNR